MTSQDKTDEERNMEYFKGFIDTVKKPTFLEQLREFNTNATLYPENVPKEIPKKDLENLKILEKEYRTFYSHPYRKYHKFPSMIDDKDDYKIEKRKMKQLYKETNPEYAKEFKKLAKKIKYKLNVWILEFDDILKYVTIIRDKPQLIRNSKSFDTNNSDNVKRIKTLFITKLMKRNNYVKLILKKYLRQHKLDPEDVYSRMYDEIKEFYVAELEKLFKKKIKHNEKLL